MAESSEFAEFIRRIRAGDDQAARELVQLYEPVIRREVRLRLRDLRLASRFDWTDICQSVMASFFVRAAAGQYDLEQPDHLLRRLESRDPAYLEGRPAAVPSPSRLVAGRELLEEFRRRLSAEERQLADLRAQGVDCAEIVSLVGGKP